MCASRRGGWRGGTPGAPGPGAPNQPVVVGWGAGVVSWVGVVRARGWEGRGADGRVRQEPAEGEAGAVGDPGRGARLAGCPGWVGGAGAGWGGRGGGRGGLLAGRGGEQPFDGDVAAFEKKAWAPTVIMPEVPEALMGTSFGHIFSGGYAAGYYGYKWAEVLDADAFSVFKSKGIFNKEVAKSFRDNILSKGGTEDPAVLYKRFRGQEPTIDALLIRNGIKK